MRGCKGDLAHVIGSNFTVSNADIAQGIPNFNFIYSSASELRFSNFTLREMNFSDSGGLMKVLDNSQIRLLNTSFRHIASSEQGLVHILGSKFDSEDMNIEDFNATFIDSADGNLTFARLKVRKGLTTESGQKLALLPSGGFLLCENCPVVIMRDTDISEVSAKAGGVLHLFGNKGGKLEIERSNFSNCYAVANGGVVSAARYFLYISESVFINNTAESGAVISTSDEDAIPIIRLCRFQYNKALTDGSCIQWKGSEPQVTETIFEYNTALYGNPMASTPRYWHLIDPSTLLPATPSLVGVTGQEMRDVLTLGEFDAMGQIISTDNSSLVYLQSESFLNLSGNTELIAKEGLANFSLMFTPFFVGVVNITVTGSSSDVIPYVFQMSLRDCEPGEIRTPTGCCPCPKNSYSLSPSDSDCSMCIENAECWGQTDMRLFPNYWRASILTDDVYECMNRGACLGGLNSDCARGYSGTLCGVCEQGYYRWVNWDCRNCEEHAPAPGRAFLIVLILLFPAALPTELVARPGGLMFNIAWSFRQLLVYAQSMTFIVLMHAKWTFDNLVYFEVMQSIGSFGSNFVYAECEYEDMSISPFTIRLIATALYPLLFLGASAIVWIATRIFRQVRLNRIFLSFSIALYHFIPIFLLVCAESLQCVEIAGKRYLVRDLSQECYTSEHLRFALSICVPLTITTIFLIGLCAKLLCSQSEQVQNTALSRYLRAAYKSKSEFWELLETSRYVVMPLFCVFFPQTEIKSQTVIIAALFVSSILLFGKYMPYQQLWMNAVSLLSQAFTISFLLICLNTNGYPVTVAGGIFLCCLLGLCCFCCFRFRKRPDVIYPLAMTEVSRFESAHYSVINSISSHNSVIAIPPPSPNLQPLEKA